MGSYKLWDEDTYIVHKYRVNQMYEHCRSRCFELEDIASRTFVCNNRTYNADGGLGTCIEKFQKATARLNALLQAMNSYYAEYTGMLESSQGTMDEVDVSNLLYGSFGGILAGGAAATAAAYNSSTAYHFHQSGFNFSTDFNDTATFMSEDYFTHFEVLEGMSNIANWETLTLDLVLHGWGSSPTDYSQGLMENALLNSLEMVPNYSVEVADGDISAYLAELTGMPDLDKEIRKIIDWVNKHAKDGSAEEFIDQLCAKVSDFLHSIGLGKFADDFIDSASENELYLEFYGMFAKVSTYIVDFAELFLDITMHAAANHLQQTAYLDSIQESLAMGGYDGGGLSNMIDDIRSKLSSKENYIWQSVRDELESIGNEQAGNLISEVGGSLITNICSNLPGVSDIAAGFNPLTGANAFFATVSTAANTLAGDQIQAVETLRGIQMYVDPLINSYERYMKMMDMGIANAEDVKQAQNLFELIRVTKMKEYECIQTIDMYGYWHDLAKEKYDQLADWGPAVWEEIGLTENPLLAGRRDDTKL